METHLHNGLFRVYWTEDDEVESFKDTGLGLRYEWYYKDGKKADGVSKGWWRNGKLKTTRTWKNGKENGLYTYWFESGQKRREIPYKNGKANGLITEWFENGQKKLEGTFKGGLANGLYTHWFPSGQKWSEKTLKNGKFVGLYTIWDEQNLHEKTYKVIPKSTTNVGVLTSSGFTDKVDILIKLISEKRWDKDGQKNFEKTYKNGKLE